MRRIVIRAEITVLVKVITLSTDSNPALDNWIWGVEKLGYDYEVLGLGEKWVNWSWRTKKYIEAIEKLPENTLVVLVDGNDILFLRGPDTLLRNWREIGKPLVFGGEPTCCTGKYVYRPMSPTGNRDRAINTIDGRGPQNRWKFPNAGCITGMKKDVLRALRLIQDAPDDQAAHLERYLLDPEYLHIDWKHSIVGNVNKPAYSYCVDCGLQDEKDSYELRFWEKSYTKDPDTIGSWILINTETGGMPCIAHFPGKNIYGYNYLGAQLYGMHFRPILPPVDISVGKSALLSISRIWKT